VLQAHTEKHKALLKRGGENRSGTWGDGANRLRPGSFGAPTEGKIPRNVLSFPHRSGAGELRPVRESMRADGLPVHGATMPLPLAEFLVDYLCPPGALTVDPFFGWGTTAMAAEKLGRRWLVTEQHLEYVEAIKRRFENHARAQQLGMARIQNDVVGKGAF